MPERTIVYYPKGVETGGPTALHQLVHALRQAGNDAYLKALPGTESVRRSPRYSSYDAPEVTGSISISDIVVYPETVPSLALSDPSVRKLIWWLSIDNSPLFRRERRLANERRYGRSRSRLGAARDLKEALATRRVVQHVTGDVNIEHLAQSHYAMGYLASRFAIRSQLLSDITELPVGGVARRRNATDGPVIAYTPTRGGPITQEVVGKNADMAKWVPIRGLDAQGVDRALRAADVFLDLGHQPGKDRLAREAAARGCVVVLAIAGAASHPADVPLPAHYLVDTRSDFVAQAGVVLSRVLADLDTAWVSQLRYREDIAGEAERFEAQVRGIFAG